MVRFGNIRLLECINHAFLTWSGNSFRLTSVLLLSSYFLVLMQLLQYSFLNVVATNVLKDVWKGPKMVSESSSSFKCKSTCPVKGKMKMELIIKIYLQFSGLSRLFL